MTKYQKKVLLRSVILISYTTVKFLTNIIPTKKCFFRNGFVCEHVGALLHSMHDSILFSQSTLGGGNKGNSSNVQTAAVKKRTNLQI